MTKKDLETLHPIHPWHQRYIRLTGDLPPPALLEQQRRLFTENEKKQLEQLRKEVQKYKNHPALLAWGIGNELNLDYTNPKVWDAVNEISKMCHELDKNHPTSTELAGINKTMADEIKLRAPDLDLLGINTYAPLAVLPAAVKASG